MGVQWERKGPGPGLGVLVVHSRLRAHIRGDTRPTELYPLVIYWSFETVLYLDGINNACLDCNGVLYKFILRRGAYTCILLERKYRA